MKPRVLFICPLPPPFGGLANNTQLLLRSELASRFGIDLLDTSRKIVRIRLHKRGIANLAHVIRCTVQLIRHLKSVRYGVVYLKSTSDVSFFREVLFMLVAKLAGVPTVLHFHANQLRYLFSGKSKLCNLVLSLCLLPADSVIYLSDSLREGFESILYFKRSRMEVLNNVVETHLFDGERAFTKTGREVLFVGRLTEEKGIWDLLHVISDMSTDYPDVTFTLAGVAESLEDEARIHAFCEERNIASQIRFLGQVEGEEKTRAFVSADLFVFPSYEEIFPNVLLEAMAAGLPVVSTRIFCIPEIVVDGEHGILIEPGDRGALRIALITLLKDDALRGHISSANYRRAREHYDVSVAADTLTCVFESVTARNGWG
jgi:glycosyltransferase involved in cell wall biosynthesis